jgi:hypothetical protein
MYIGAFAQPSVYGASTSHSIYYTTGSMVAIAGTSVTAITTAGSPLTATTGTNYVYWSGSGANLAVTQNLATAQAGSWLYTCADNGSGVTGCVPVSSILPTTLYAVGSTTGSGLNVLQTSPTLITPALGAATYTTLAGGVITNTATSNQFLVGTTNVTTLSFTAPATSQTLTFPDPGGSASAAYANPTTAQTISNTVFNSAASNTSRAGLNMPAGTAPTTPAIGDMWADSTRKAVMMSPTVASNPLAVSGALTVLGAQTPITTVTTIQAMNSTAVTVPAGAMNVAGKTLHVKGYFTFSNASTTPVITITLKLGSVVMAAPVSTANVNSNSSSPAWFEFYAKTATTGASGTVEAHGTLDMNVTDATNGHALSRFSDYLAAVSSAVDLTTAENITINMTADATVTTATLREASFEILN